MAVDLNKKLAELKAKRQAVEQAIVALQQLDAEYGARAHPQPISCRRPVQSLKAVPSRKTA